MQAAAVYRIRPMIQAEIAPLEITGTEAARAWARATEILLRAKARQDARLRETHDGETVSDAECAPLEEVSRQHCL